MERAIENSQALKLREEKELIENLSYGDAIKEVGSSLKAIVRSEVVLMKAEVSKVVPEFQKNVSQLMLATSIYALGLLPFMAFLVLGLGEFALNGQYWLSSLIVSAVFLLIAVPLRARALKKMKTTKYFEKSIENLDRSFDVIENKIEEFVLASKGAKDERVH